MALQGTLDTFALPDVLHLLAATKKTGRLRLTSDRRAGSVWVDGGQAVAVAADHAPLAVAPVDALFELLRFDEGSFAFEADERTDTPGPASDIDSLLDEASALLAEWREIESVVPSLDAYVTLRRELDGDVTISQAQWPTLVAIGAGSTVRAMGERLELAELPVSRAVRDLVELGIIDLEERAPEPAVAVMKPEPASVAEGATLGQASTVDLTTLTETVEPEPVLAPLASWAERDDDDDDELEDPDALPTARPIRARRPRPRTLDGQAQPDHFVPLDLPGHMSPAAASEVTEPTDLDGPLDDLAAAFPGLALRDTGEGLEDDDEVARQLAALSPEAMEAVKAAADAPTEEAREAALGEAFWGEEPPINRGLLLRFLGSKS